MMHIHIKKGVAVVMGWSLKAHTGVGGIGKGCNFCNKYKKGA